MGKVSKNKEKKYQGPSQASPILQHPESQGMLAMPGDYKDATLIR